MVETLKPLSENRPMAKMEDYVTVTVFSESTGVTVQAVHKAMQQRRIKDFKRLGPIWLIHKSEIQRFKESRV